MAAKKPTVPQIIAQAKTARRELTTLEHELQEGIDAIDFRAFEEKRDLTAAEIKQRKAHRSTQAEIREGLKTLAYVTARRLDISEEVVQLHRQMKAINASLKDDLEKLKKIEKYAKIAAKVTDALAKAAAKLAAKMI